MLTDQHNLRYSEKKEQLTGDDDNLGAVAFHGAGELAESRHRSDFASGTAFGAVCMSVGQLLVCDVEGNLPSIQRGISDACSFGRRRALREMRGGLIQRGRLSVALLHH